MSIRFLGYDTNELNECLVRLWITNGNDFPVMCAAVHPHRKTANGAEPLAICPELEILSRLVDLHKPKTVLSEPIVFPPEVQ